MGEASCLETMTALATVGICICTKDRPESLRLCLQGIAAGSLLPDEVIVSDDSKSPEDTVALCLEFAFVRYIVGPKTGLCANRNMVVAASRSTHLALIDDDAVLAKDFVRRALQHARTEEPKIIVTGSVLEFGTQLFSPGCPDIWGNFTQKTRNGQYETIQLNCNLFPRSSFDCSQFDELIQYGFEDMDLCSHLLAMGYQIKWDPELINFHYPPVQTTTITSERFRQWERARYYTSLKRYILWKRRPLLGIFYALVAPLYTMMFSAKWGKWERIPFILPDMIVAVKLFLHSRERERNKIFSSS